jgi:hypothetical protein
MGIDKIRLQECDILQATNHPADIIAYRFMGSRQNLLGNKYKAGVVSRDDLQFAQQG